MSMFIGFCDGGGEDGEDILPLPVMLDILFLDLLVFVEDEEVGMGPGPSRKTSGRLGR